MKQSEILSAVLSGQKLAVGEYRDWEIKTFPAKQANEQPTIIQTFFVLMGREVVSVQQFAERGTEASSLKRPAWKVGDKLVVLFRDWQATKWGIRVSGTVEQLTS